MKRILIIAVIVIAIAAGASLFYASRPAIYHDGIYTGSASGAFGDIKITIELKDGRITACRLEAIDKEGNIKDENYGRSSGEKNYQLAQIALQGIMKYPAMLLEAQDVEKIDAVSGATVSFMEFQSAVKQALERSRREAK